jgi:hypothetical protein
LGPFRAFYCCGPNQLQASQRFFGFLVFFFFGKNEEDRQEEKIIIIIIIVADAFIGQQGCGLLELKQKNK